MGAFAIAHVNTPAVRASLLRRHAPILSVPYHMAARALHVNAYSLQIGEDRLTERIL